MNRLVSQNLLRYNTRYLSFVSPLKHLITMPDTAAIRQRSPSPPAKRIKLAHDYSNSALTEVKSTATADVKAPIPSVVDTSRAVSDETTGPTTQPSASLADLVEEEMAKPIEVPKTYEKEISYENKLVLAPMVRTGSSKSTFLGSGQLKMYI